MKNGIMLAIAVVTSTAILAEESAECMVVETEQVAPIVPLRPYCVCTLCECVNCACEQDGSLQQRCQKDHSQAHNAPCSNDDVQ